MQARRIAVLGISASGKSTFSRSLAERTGLPLFHLDQLYWREDWIEVPAEEYLSRHAELVSEGEWIIEGYIDARMAERLVRSDLVIFLDYPGWLCAWRSVKRWLKHRKKSRPELPAEAKEKLSLTTVWKIFSRKERIPLLDSLHTANPRNLTIVRWPRHLKRFC